MSLDCSKSYWGNNGELQEQYDKLHKELVPSSGKAPTTAGELLRQVANFYYDLFNNGWGNGPFDLSIFEKEESAFEMDMDRVDYSVLVDLIKNYNMGEYVIDEEDFNCQGTMSAMDSMVTTAVRLAQAMMERASYMEECVREAATTHGIDSNDWMVPLPEEIGLDKDCEGGYWVNVRLFVQNDGGE